MFLSKDSVLALFFQMSSLYPGGDVSRQGGTQFFSETKYFLALDRFRKLEGRDCNTADREDRNRFIENVGSVVRLSDPDAEESCDTKNFFDSFGTGKDLDIGSNFFSSGAVARSMSSVEPIAYPSRHPQLFECKRGTIRIIDEAYERFANQIEYLSGSVKNFALLFLWLNRYTEVSDRKLTYKTFLDRLKSLYSPQMTASLKWDSPDVRQKIDSLLELLDFDNQPANLAQGDLSFNGQGDGQVKRLFSIYLDLNSSSRSPGYRQHSVEVCECWLDKKLPGNRIGNLFRHRDPGKFKEELSRIRHIPSFGIIDKADSNGRPSAALNNYCSFLESMPFAQEKIEIEDRPKDLFELVRNELGKHPERIQELRKLLSGASNPHEAIPAKSFDFPIFRPAQLIYYGVPGSGKSRRVNDEINAELDRYGLKDKEFHKMRCVFHPEYGNADFVGQIYPCVLPDGGVDYRFKPGPLAEILRRAYRNPDKPFFLIVEEINRGNAAAIFGEMFQLLDRIKPGDPAEELSGNIYTEGFSAYGIDNADVNAYVRLSSAENSAGRTYDGRLPYGPAVTFSVNTAIRLPPNLSIYATMNTSDQNVFAPDNAFQRRFQSKMIRNCLDENSAQYNLQIAGTGVCWGDFWKWINGKILSQALGISHAEDRCLGGWFIIGKPGESFPKDEFAEKVLKYLWDDVFRRCSGSVFQKEKIRSLSQLIETFESAGGFGAFEKIFSLTDEEKSLLQRSSGGSGDEISGTTPGGETF